MNILTLKSERKLTKGNFEKIYERENKITSIRLNLPAKVGNYNTNECNVELRAYIGENDYIGYEVDTSKIVADVPITTDITEKAQTVNFMCYITHNGNVIGKTNFVSVEVLEAPEESEPLTPREQFDTVIAEQRQTIQNQAETISEQTAEITEKTEQITELNGQVTELTSENTRLENLTDTQRDTIQNMLDNPPQPKLYTPPVITPSGSVQQINPPTGYDGLNNAVVDRVSAEGVNFHSEWYKEGKECLGEVGTYNPFPEHSYGGIYYTELGEGGYPKKILIKDMLRSASAIPQFFNTSNDAKRELREVVFENCPEFLEAPYGIFQGFNYLTKVTLPNSLTSIGVTAFRGCSSITELTLPNSLTSIGGNAFDGCSSITELTLPNSLTSIGGGAFWGCSSITELTLPNSLTSIGVNAFWGCSSITELALAQGFNCNGLNVSFSTRFSVETLIAMLEALADRTGETAYTLTIGTTNINKLTAEQRAIATNKNWNLA